MWLAYRLALPGCSGAALALNAARRINKAENAAKSVSNINGKMA